MGRFSSFAVVGIILLSPYVRAEQSPSLFELSLDELLATSVETASKYLEPVTESPAVSTVISREEINGFGANNLFEVLERVVGVYMTGSSFFAQNVMSIRGDLLGHYDNHILMLLNGRPIRESYAGGVNFAVYTALPLGIIERIEVIRGPGSALYGTNAYSGVVNIITRETEQQTIAATVGSFDTQALEWVGGIKTERLGANWGVKHFQEQGWRFNAKDNNGLNGSMDAQERDLGVFFDGHYDDFRLNFLYLDSRQNFMGAAADWSGQPPVDERTMDSTRWFIDFSHDVKLNEEWQLQSHLSWANMEFDHYNYLAKSTDTNLEVTAFWRPSAQWHWLFGATAWQQEVGSEAGLTAAPVPDFSATWYSAYSQLDFKPTPDLKLVAGLQWNKADNLSSDMVSRLGVTYQLTDKVGVKLMHAQAYRAAFGVETGFSLILTNPDGSVRGGLRGNPNLLPEKIITTDMQLFYHAKFLQLSATVFRSDLTDLVTRQRAPDNVIDFVNRGELEIRGWELESKYNVAENWHFTASYSYQHNHANGVENFTTVPNHLFKIGAIYQSQNGFSAGLYLNDVSAATDIAVQNPARNAYNPNADAYQQLSLKLSLDLGHFWSHLKDYRLSLYGYNLLDEDVYQPDFIGKRINTLPARAGRSGYLNLTVRF
ncbi:TonB-dependent receptor plug domain-containing protein [Pseudoalteromonas fenneropenaei]|uniref:TonB-dependent receptor plug domain-containing protein n=1 Tax=Pseudoalteromonas fenneropenaei TaxID=1737459 RepID=A0ABV7CGM9_9GAMM